MKTKAMLLAAGLGTRLRPLTLQVPKCLVPVRNRPLMDYWVEKLIQAGIRDALINTHYLPDQVREYITRVNELGNIRLTEFFEPQLLGSAGTIAANPDFSTGTDAVLVIYTDNYSDMDLKELLAFHQDHDDPVTMMLFHAPNPSSCGIAELDARSRIVQFREKPKHPMSDLANGGIYVFDSHIYRQVAEMNAFDLGYDVLPGFTGSMRGWIWDGYHKDIGTHDAYAQVLKDTDS